ncbi:MAG TPA: hypothetical protein VI168_03210 [Croceibacterium sp.]
MLAIAVSLLFGFTAFAALAVIVSSLLAGSRRARAILAELAEIDARPRVTRSAAARPAAVLQPALAVA